MAKQNSKKKDESVTNCDQFEITKCDIQNVIIENLIHNVRGQRVMFDFDLAMLYKVETRSLNQSVKRNTERFPDDFMFQLTKHEWNSIKSQIAIFKPTDNENDTNLTSQFVISSWGGSRSIPFVFTRNGIGMLSSVLKSKTAIEVNKRIMRAFTAIPDLVNNNTLMMQRILNIEQHQTETDEKVNQILITIEERTPKQLPEQVFNSGCVWDAWTYVSDLIRSAKHRVVLIDNYVDDRVLSLLDKRADGVEATIHTRYNETLLTDLNKHNDQYREINLMQLPHRNHDRFLIIDTDVYLLGASVKDMGMGLCAITRMQTSPDTILQMLK
jgi:hypothetical protein